MGGSGGGGSGKGRETEYNAINMRPTPPPEARPDILGDAAAGLIAAHTGYGYAKKAQQMIKDRFANRGNVEDVTGEQEDPGEVGPEGGMSEKAFINDPDMPRKPPRPLNFARKSISTSREPTGQEMTSRGGIRPESGAEFQNIRNRWAETDMTDWPDRQTIEEFYRDNPEARPAGTTEATAEEGGGEVSRQLGMMRQQLEEPEFHDPASVNTSISESEYIRQPGDTELHNRLDAESDELTQRLRELRGQATTSSEGVSTTRFGVASGTQTEVTGEEVQAGQDVRSGIQRLASSMSMRSSKNFERGGDIRKFNTASGATTRRGPPEPMRFAKVGKVGDLYGEAARVPSASVKVTPDLTGSNRMGTINESFSDLMARGSSGGYAVGESQPADPEYTPETSAEEGGAAEAGEAGEAAEAAEGAADADIIGDIAMFA